MTCRCGQEARIVTDTEPNGQRTRFCAVCGGSPAALEQTRLSGLPARTVPTTARRSTADRGLSGLPLSLEGQEAARTEQGKLL